MSCENFENVYVQVEKLLGVGLFIQALLISTASNLAAHVIMYNRQLLPTF